MGGTLYSSTFKCDASSLSHWVGGSVSCECRCKQCGVARRTMQSATSRGAGPNRQPLQGKILGAHVTLSFNTFDSTVTERLKIKDRRLQITNLSLTCTKEVTANIKTVKVHMLPEWTDLLRGLVISPVN